MSALLVITALGIIILGYLIMRRIDSFIADGGFIDSREGRRKMGVLIFGSHAAACAALNAGIQCTELVEPALPQNNGYYSAIFILSEHESENLALCRAAHQEDPDLCIIVRCADSRLKEVYTKLGACHVLSPDEPVEAMLSELWGILK
jgi:hypothetical protein